MPPNPESQFLHFKRVDISLETSDSEATSSAAAGKNLSKQASASMRLAVAPTTSTSATSEPLTTASNQQERQSRLMQQQQDDYNESQRDRSKSPRPQTLPGLKTSASTKTSASSEDRMKPTTSPLVSSLLILLTFFAHHTPSFVMLYLYINFKSLEACSVC